MPLRDGERQVAASLDDIREDHVERYRWAAERVDKGDAVVDCGCGVGYGAALLAEKADRVVGFERDPEAVDFARRHWARENVAIVEADLNEPTGYGGCETAVAFEVIEHLADPRPFLRGLRKQGIRRLFASVPNEAVYPHRTPTTTVKFHHRHYTREEFENLLNDCGWKVDEWWGQRGATSAPERDVEGRTLIAAASPVAAIEISKGALFDMKDGSPAVLMIPTKRPLKHVAIVALGGSAESYMCNLKTLGDRFAFCDEVWAINAMGSIIACDLIFHMDDVRIQEIRARARPDSNIAHLVQFLKTTHIPVMTSQPHPDYPSTIAFPFEDVANDLGQVYFNNTIAYAVAYAIHRKVEVLSLFGCDFGYGNLNKAERGRACVEYWLGVADARGIRLNFPKNSPLCDSIIADSADDVYAYGYDALRIAYRDDGGRMRFSFAPRETLPTADEIEGAYDHGKNPNDQIPRRLAAE